MTTIEITMDEAKRMTEPERRVFRALWKLCGEHRVEVGEPHSRYAITGDIVRKMARAAVAAAAKR